MKGFQKHQSSNAVKQMSWTLLIPVHIMQVDPAVSAIVHYVSSQYYKQKKNFADFYKSSLLYLAFVSSESLPVDLKRVRLACMVLLCCRL